MTSTLTRPDTETVTADTAEPRPGSPTSSSETPDEPAAPKVQTFTVGTVTIEARSEDEALRKYKRMVRSEGLKAKEDMDWCVAGTNERLERLGVRRIGEGVAIRVVVTATRTMYLTVDADDDDEAQQMMADRDDYITTLAKENMPSGWKVAAVEPAPPRQGEYAIGQTDDTLSCRAVLMANPGARSCEKYSSRHGYCSRPAGHVEAGDRQHARGNGSEIIAVWKERAARPAQPGEVTFSRGDRVEDDTIEGSESCNMVGVDGLYCTRIAGHLGQHVPTYGDHMAIRDGWFGDWNE